MKTFYLMIIILVGFSLPFSCASSGSEKQASQPAIQEAAISKNVSAKEFNDLITSRNDVIILDVRTKGEVDKGHLEHSINLDFYAEDFKDQLAKIDKDKPVLIYCHSGRRSAIAMSSMRQLGFKEVYNLQAGILAWNAAGLEIVR